MPTPAAANPLFNPDYYVDESGEVRSALFAQGLTADYDDYYWGMEQVIPYRIDRPFSMIQANQSSAGSIKILLLDNRDTNNLAIRIVPEYAKALSRGAHLAIFEIGMIRGLFLYRSDVDYFDFVAARLNHGNGTTSNLNPVLLGLSQFFHTRDLFLSSDLIGAVVIKEADERKFAFNIGFDGYIAYLRRTFNIRDLNRVFGDVISPFLQRREFDIFRRLVNPALVSLIDHRTFSHVLNWVQSNFFLLREETERYDVIRLLRSLENWLSKFTVLYQSIHTPIDQLSYAAIAKPQVVADGPNYHWESAAFLQARGVEPATSVNIFFGLARANSNPNIFTNPQAPEIILGQLAAAHHPNTFTIVGELRAIHHDLSHLMGK